LQRIERLVLRVLFALSERFRNLILLAMAHFSNLRIYQASLNGIKSIYKLVNTFPLSKDFSLCDQIKRAAASIPANIAESYGRTTKKDRAVFISYALGSANEVVAFLDVIESLYPKINTSKEKDYYLALARQIHAFRNKLPNS
jgi:four helix bundle protein